MFFDTRALDSFDQYLQDVERYPLIQDPATEREIARKARAGDRQAAERLVKMPELASHLRGYRDEYPERYAAVLANPVVASWARETNYEK